ncbi:LysR family transcriptional regulator [Vibrio hippocampi]|uniref:HTH-type transcriptional regulator YidZ n=1 Tax=Vibrio hippocampi TaxID=654686 RepID=A0ABN8DM79_9VIBR|nr:LysR family transcriptional regulator [Vibrio hippocampi]CAH0529509.1 HTH-type transcriptional regulator YidZ [Vibrio hippocampi]
MKSSLEEMDLNLLKLLRTLVKTGSTSRTAVLLGISQTSVSRGVAKLKETFGDQLFNRKSHGIEASELAQQLAAVADNMLLPFEEVIQNYQTFDSDSYDGLITISAELSLLEVFGPGIHRAISEVFPQAKLKLNHWQETSLDKMLDRQIDYMLHYSLLPLPQEIYTQTLTEMEICLVARKDHPVLIQSSAWTDIHQLPLVKLQSSDTRGKYDIYDELYLTKGYQPDIVLTTHSIPIIMDKLLHSDAIKFSSSYLISHHKELACYPLPAIPKEMQKLGISGGYLRSKRNDPMNQRIHQVLRQFFQQINVNTLPSTP